MMDVQTKILLLIDGRDHLFQSAVLEEASLCNERQIEIAMLSTVHKWQIWPLHNVC